MVTANAGDHGSRAGLVIAVRLASLLQVLAGLGWGARPAAAQTDFYNLDKDRPARIEDAYTSKRYAFEVQGSPLTLSDRRGNGLCYTPAVELKHGVLPGMELSAGVNVAASRTDQGTHFQLGDLELSGLVNLTVETWRLPALGLRVTGHIPLHADAGSSVEVKGIATRGIAGPVRVHVNGAGILGDAAERWWAGLAVDYVLPFRHILLLAETYVSSPYSGARRVHSTAGFRYQIGPTLTLDAGLGRSWTGDSGDDWLITLGLAREFGVRSLMPFARR
jgi:hypothetical protein